MDEISRHGNLNSALAHQPPDAQVGAGRYHRGEQPGTKTDKDPRPVIGLQVTDNWNEIITEADRVARESDLPDSPLSFVRINGHSGIEDYFFDECKPFYLKKKWFGLFM